jgi:hypothetical protein
MLIGERYFSFHPFVTVYHVWPNFPAAKARAFSPPPSTLKQQFLAIN